MAIGLATSLGHPAGNITGTMLGTLHTSKALELLQSVDAGLAHFAILFNSASANPQATIDILEQTATTAGILTRRVAVRSADEFESAFAQMRAWPAQAMYAAGDASLINPHYSLIADLAMRSRLPSMTGLRSYPEAGGLMSYAPNSPAILARAASHVDRILRGANPGGLPIERPTVFEFVVNLNTAQALGIAFPPDVAAQVTEWIQ
jgi:putative ABC transport system substrate-binding protein